MSSYPARVDSEICRNQDGENDAQKRSEKLSDSKTIATGILSECSIVEIGNKSFDPKPGTIHRNGAYLSDKIEVNTDDEIAGTSLVYAVSPSALTPSTDLLASTPLIGQSLITCPNDVVYLAESTLDTRNIVGSVLHDPLSPSIPPSADSSEIPLGDVMAFDAYMRGDYSIGQVLPEYLPQPLKIPLKVVVEENIEIGVQELEDTSSGRCGDSEEAKGFSLDSDPMGMFNYGYLKPEEWYQSQLLLHQGAKAQKVDLSTGVDVKSLATSIHDISSSREKPLPVLPTGARELLLRRNTASGSTKPNSRGATDFSLHSKYSIKLQDFDSTLKRRPVPPRIETITSEISSTTSNHRRSRSLVGERNISPALIHPAFRQDALDSSKRFATKDDLRNISVAMTRYGHERVLSNSTQSSMFSPSKPPSSPPGSYLHSPPMSPKHPSIAFSDPLPFRSTSGSPITQLSASARSLSDPRASLEMTGPDSPYIQRNYRPEPRRSRGGLKEYAEAIETMHGLIRDRDIDDENEDPLILKKHEILNYGNIPNPSITKVNLLAGNNKTWPMKKKSSRLRRMSIVEFSNENSINNSACSLAPVQQFTEQARPVSSTSEYSVTGEPGNIVNLASTTSLMSQRTTLEKRQAPILERKHRPGPEKKEIYNLKFSEKEHAAVMKDLHERRGIKARWLTSLEKLVRERSSVVKGLLTIFTRKASL